MDVIEHGPSRSFQDINPVAGGLGRRASATRIFQINFRAQSQEDRGRKADQEHHDFCNLLQCLSNFEQSEEIAFANIGDFVGAALFGLGHDEHEHAYAHD